MTSPFNSIDRSPPSPAVLKLRSIVATNWSLPENAFDEVYPGILLGNGVIAKDVIALGKLGVTHILNAACGVDHMKYVDTSELFYMARNFKCKFMGIPAMDAAHYQLHRYFNETSAFIDEAVRDSDGKILVHCLQGLSRSATLVIAYLMIKRGMPVFEAVELVRSKRNIYPNEGFLKQLNDLDSYHSRLRIAYQQNHYSLR